MLTLRVPEGLQGHWARGGGDSPGSPFSRAGASGRTVSRGVASW